MRPPVGGVASPQNAMIFYAAHGGPDACGVNCSDWIAAEGAVEWDTFKRLFAFLDRFGQTKRPIVLDIRDSADIRSSMSLGKIIRSRGLDVRVATTRVTQCAKATEAECFALKRSGQPLDASIDTSAVECNYPCVIVLAGGVHRTLPADARVTIGSTEIRNRVAPNVDKDIKRELGRYFDEQVELYLAQMGISTEIVGIIDHDVKTHQATKLSNEQCLKLGIVTGLAL